MNLQRSPMRVIGIEMVPPAAMMQLPTWAELLADTACCGTTGKMKVVARFSINPIDSLVLCHQNIKDLSRQNKVTVAQRSECLIGKLFQTTVTTFLKSQLEHCRELKVSVSGSNYELFRGRVRNLKISAKGAVYKGINLTDVQLVATDIKLKRSSSRILQEPFQVRASIQINEQDILSSLASPLLAKTLHEMSSGGIHITKSVSDIKFSLKEGDLQLQTKSLPKNLRFACTSLNLTEERQRTALKLKVEDEGKSLCIFCSNIGHAGGGEHAFMRKFWLGPDVHIKKLEVQTSKILLDGDFLVRP